MRSFLIVVCLALPLTGCVTAAEQICRDERGLQPGTQAYADCAKVVYDGIVERTRRHRSVGDK